MQSGNGCIVVESPLDLAVIDMLHSICRCLEPYLNTYTSEVVGLPTDEFPLPVSYNPDTNKFNSSTALPKECNPLYPSNMAGDSVVSGTSNLQPSHTLCCASCKANPKCNVWVYCPVQEGCSTGFGKVSVGQVVRIFERSGSQGITPG